MDFNIDDDYIRDLIEKEEKLTRLKEQSMKEDDEMKISKEDLKYYYEHLFPTHTFFKWLGKQRSDYFERREISFTLQGDIYKRYLSYSNADEFKKDLLKQVPIKIDIGAVYNTSPKFKDIVAPFLPIEKEFIFDIDMTDYDIVRTCCLGAKVCKNCWNFMIVAYEVISNCLIEDWGFNDLIWIFSGRRGIHCWINDDRARKLNNQARAVIADFMKLKLLSNTDGVYYEILTGIVNPSINRSINICENFFESVILDGQDFFNHTNRNAFVKQIIKTKFKDIDRNNTLEKIIDNILNSKETSKKKFEKILKELSRYEDTNNNKKKETTLPANFTKTESTKREIMLNILYPRLDINVSKHINHLLKSPFCVHPKTGMISIPLSKEDFYNFDFSKIPNISSCIRDHKNSMKTSLDKYIIYFDGMSESFNKSS